MLLVYFKAEIETIGSVELNCIVRGKREKINFTVIDLNVQPVIGNCWKV